MVDVAMGRSVRRHRFTVDEYHRMGEAGIFGEDDRVELIDGEVVEMSPIGWRHAWCVRAVARLLVRFAEERAVHGESFGVDVQNPLHLHEYGEPQPDLVLLERTPVGHLPGPEDVALVVEVADTTLRYDREVKLPLYAEAGIREAWIFDLSANRVEVYSEPGSVGYRKTVRYVRGERATSATVPGLAFDADEALPPEEQTPTDDQ